MLVGLEVQKLTFGEDVHFCEKGLPEVAHQKHLDTGSSCMRVTLGVQDVGGPTYSHRKNQQLVSNFGSESQLGWYSRA